MRSPSWILLAILGLASSACGGRVDPGDDGGARSGSGSGAGDGSSGVTVPPCPSDPPTPGMMCVGPGQQGCAYFTNGACQAFLCDDSSVWQTTPEGC